MRAGILKIGLVASLGLITPTAARADGLAFKGRDLSQWAPLAENEQVAAIDYREGLQRMRLVVQLELTDPADRGLWIVPIPGRLDQVRVDLSDEFPRFGGRDPLAVARRTIAAIGMAIRASQVLPVSIELCGMLPSLGRVGDGSAQVGSSIEKWGLRAETLRAATLEDLAVHFAGQGVGVTAGQLDSLTPYLDGQFVFVATWIASETEVKREFPGASSRRLSDRRPCLDLAFPAEKPWFPLRATRPASSTPIGLRLYVSGYVKPLTTTPLLDLDSRFYVTTNWNVAWDGPQPRSTPTIDRPYTLITAALPNSTPIDDLCFTPEDPFAIRYANFVSALPGSTSGFMALCAVFVVISAICGVIAGQFVGLRPGESARLGLFNLITIFGIAIALRDHYAAKGIDKKAAAFQSRVYLLSFMLSFIVISATLQWIALRPLET